MTEKAFAVVRKERTLAFCMSSQKMHIIIDSEEIILFAGITPENKQ